jgi:hypothetical protein
MRSVLLSIVLATAVASAVGSFVRDELTHVSAVLALHSSSAK